MLFSGTLPVSVSYPMPRHGVRLMCKSMHRILRIEVSNAPTVTYRVAAMHWDFIFERWAKSRHGLSTTGSCFWIYREGLTGTKVGYRRSAEIRWAALFDSGCWMLDAGSRMLF